MYGSMIKMARALLPRLGIVPEERISEASPEDLAMIVEFLDALASPEFRDDVQEVGRLSRAFDLEGRVKILEKFLPRLRDRLPSSALLSVDTPSPVRPPKKRSRTDLGDSTASAGPSSISAAPAPRGQARGRRGSSMAGGAMSRTSSQGDSSQGPRRSQRRAAK